MVGQLTTTCCSKHCYIQVKYTTETIIMPKLQHHDHQRSLNGSEFQFKRLFRLVFRNHNDLSMPPFSTPPPHVRSHATWMGITSCSMSFSPEPKIKEKKSKMAVVRVTLSKRRCGSSPTPRVEWSGAWVGLWVWVEVSGG